MANQIIRQPDGKLAVFSSSTSDWVIRDATPQELLDWFAQEAAQRARKEAQRALEAVLAGNPELAYPHFTQTFEQADAISSATKQISRTNNSQQTAG